MINKIILASKSKVRKKILEQNDIICQIIPSNVDEEMVKQSLGKEKATSEYISKNLAELKANKVSQKYLDSLVIGADSVIDLNGKIISKPTNRKEALEILKNLNGQTHQLISSVCISRNGKMIWNYTDKAKLTMRKMTDEELINYLSKLSDEALYSYNVYQIEGLGKSLFSKIDGNKNSIMGIPVEKIKTYLTNYDS
jgi:septum formation protein